LLIWHSKYSAIVVKNTLLLDCFFGDFTHWAGSHFAKLPVI